MAAATALCEALTKGISTGNFVDTKIILYSHRDSSGRVCRPKALYTNSHILKTVPYFNDLLFGNFTESQSKDFGEEIDEEESADSYGYLSDSDLEDEEVPSFKSTTKSGAFPSNPFAIPGEDNIPCEEREEYVKKGKVVKIPDIAHVTFQAFLRYLYTGKIVFAPFGSEGNRRPRDAGVADPSIGEVPLPSSRSMYRLADKYDVPALRTLALGCIRNGLGTCDIVKESFSIFASQYSEIRSLYVEQLAFNLIEDSTTETTRAGVEEKIDSFVEGGLGHSAEVLSALWEILNKDEDIKSPSNTPLFWRWGGKKKNKGGARSMPSVAVEALAKSIRTGAFFDRKYWARDGNTLRPIYFSSVIMNNHPQGLNELVKYVNCQNPLTGMGNLGQSVDVESDCEGDFPEAQDQLLEEENGGTRAVLMKGSFSAWRSLFFYRCTGDIKFAPLKSQGIDSRSKYVRENTVVGAPAPCSPKSIYVLANQLGMELLCGRAFADIRCKLSLDNIVDEVFSPFTSSQENITEMQCGLLTSNFRDPKTIALVKDNIDRISNAPSPHSGRVLKLGLKKAIEFKKKNRKSTEQQP